MKILYKVPLVNHELKLIVSNPKRSKDVIEAAYEDEYAPCGEQYTYASNKIEPPCVFNM